MKKQLSISFGVILFIVLGTIGVILYGTGYRFGLDNQGKPDFFGTGILALSSRPEGAAVEINGHLTTATNNTINLTPGTYDVKIYQDRYQPWEKKVTIKEGEVTRADALLFPKAPQLESITADGVMNPVIDPSFTKIAFVATPSAGTNIDPKKNGIFVLDMSSRPLLTLQSNLTQLVDDTTDAFSTGELAWSPDGKNITASISANRQTTTTYLLDATTFNQSPQDVTETLTSVMTSWEKAKEEKQTAQLNSLKPVLRQIVTNDLTILDWSEDETKILYQATTSATIPQIINPPIKGTDTTAEERNITAGNFYVYDIKEDKNFKLPIDSQDVALTWLPDDSHIIYTHDHKIDIMDYDGLNQTTIWAGPFVDHYVFPWPDGSKIVILTNFNNTQIPANLYTISLK